MIKETIDHLVFSLTFLKYIKNILYKHLETYLESILPQDQWRLTKKRFSVFV